MSTEENMTNEQRVNLITEMINQARFNFSKGSFYFILWGALLFLAAIYEYAGMNVLDNANPWIGWPIAGVLGGIISAIYSSRAYKGMPITHLDRVYTAIWFSFFITLIILIVVLVRQELAPGSYILILTGLPTFLTGRVLKFAPLQLGGVGFWVIGLFSLFVASTNQPLFFAAAMILGYMVPGLLMRKQKEQHV